MKAIFKFKETKNWKNHVNGFLAEIGREFHESIPLGAIFDSIRAYGIIPIQEDGTPWSGFFCGESGSAHIELKGSNHWLHIQWYKRCETGRYEVVSYVG
jgi:hypothetical protein